MKYPKKKVSFERGIAEQLIQESLGLAIAPHPKKGQDGK
jgi:hypothetical protein